MSSRLSSVRSGRSSHGDVSERSPLLPRGASSDDTLPSDSISAPRSRQQWPSFVALALLCGGAMAVLALGFFAPAATQQYAQQAVVFDVTNLSAHSFSEKGLDVRVQANVGIDTSRVSNPVIRTLGQIGSTVLRRVTVNALDVRVYLLDYNGALLGSAAVPDLTIDIRNGRFTDLDFVSSVEPGSLEAIRSLAYDYMTGSLTSVNLLGEIYPTLKSGLLSFYAGKFDRKLILRDVPSLPTPDITKVRVEEILVDGGKAVMANASVQLKNSFPLELDIPALGFLISLPGCNGNSRLATAAATTSAISIRPKSDIILDLSSMIRSFPADLTAICPDTHLSPMDAFLGPYLHGERVAVYISGDGSNLNNGSPQWLVEFLHSVSLPVVVPGHTFGDVIRSFSLSQVNIKLPGPEDDPATASPLLSATVEVTVKIPDDIHISIGIARLKAVANISYAGEVFGNLDIRKWISTTSQRIPEQSLLLVKGTVRDTPLNITDYAVFQRVVRELLFGNGRHLSLAISGTADAGINTSFGDFIIHQIPASGNVTLDTFPDFSNVGNPTVKDIIVHKTTEHSMDLEIAFFATNPTDWNMLVPYANVHMSHNGAVLGNGTVRNVRIVPGKNDVVVTAAWDPRTYGGEDGEKLGASLIGKYISGFNTTMTFSTHKGSFPSLPSLGEKMSTLNITMPLPRLETRGDSDPHAPSHFIESATVHAVLSTADFLIRNPLPHDSIIINTLDGVAIYNGSTLGTINYESKFLISPGKRGSTLTPRFPVEWSLGGVGYEVMKKAIGGQLKIYAQAHCKLSIGNLRMEVLYNGSDPVGAHVRF